MRQITLYTGDGVSLSPQSGEGRTVSQYTRLIADDGKAITNGSIVTICIDVPSAEIVNWSDCDLSAVDDEISDTPEQSEMDDRAAALTLLGVTPQEG